MTQEFLEKRIRSFRRFGLVAFFGPAALFVGPLCFFFLCDLLKWSPVGKDAELYILSSGVFAFFPIAGILIYWGERRYRVLCPHCGQSLITHYPVVLATGKCANCQKPVVEASA